MKITDFLSAKGIKLDLDATDKEGVLKEMVDLLTEVKDFPPHLSDPGFDL